MPSKKSNSVDFDYLNDDKVQKGKKQTMDKLMKGPSHKERHEESKSARRESRKASMRHEEKVSWRVKVLGVFFVVFLCGVGLFQFVQKILSFVVGTGIRHVDVQDTAKVKDVLFGGDPWLVYCVNNKTANQRLPEVLEESARPMSTSLGLKTVVMSCWDQTASGRSIAKRFKLRDSPPLSFVVANGNKPRILNLVGASKTEELEKKIAPALKVVTYKIDTLKKWSTMCASRRTCVVIGHKKTAQRDTALNIVRPLQTQFRAIKVVTLDTSFWQLKLNDTVLQTRPSDKKGSADVLCLAKDDTGSGGNASYKGVFLQSLDDSSASAFFQACEKRVELVPIGSTAPRINARPSKPKKAQPAPLRNPQPTPPPSPSREKPKAKIDRVGSRDKMESEDEVLFEAVEEEDTGDEKEGDDSDGNDEQSEGEGEEQEDGGEEVEL